ncbi:MAG: methyltransferase domain-containing protein [Bdellovibrionales bacterium]|nr:methyltransferase domain-containing protein [Bdellovibrionales bacterium]
MKGESAGVNRPTLLLAGFLLSACSIVYELLIAQVISVFAGNTVVWYSLTIGLFLAGMGIGALIVGPLIKHRSSAIAFFWTEATLCLLGALAPYALHVSSLSVLWQTKGDEWFPSGMPFFFAAAAIAFAVGLFTGVELPLLMQRGREIEFGQKQISFSQLLAADYFGSLFGALAFSLLLWPNLEPTQIGPGVAAINLLTAVIIAATPSSSSGRWTRIASAGFLGGLLTVLIASNQQFMEFFLRRYYVYGSGSSSLSEMIDPSHELPRVSRVRSQYHTIDLVQSVYHDRGFYVFDLFSTKFQERPDFPQRYMMFLNGEVQFFADFEEVYHEFFAHVPIAAFGAVPRRVLVLGGGDGLLLRELVKYPEIEKITLVDLDPAMIEFARNNRIMKTINNGAFNDPRVNVVIGDAYHFTRTAEAKFDAVYMDFPEISDFNLARLYSREFYYFVLQHLSENGYVVMNAGEIEYLSVPDENNEQHMTEKNRWPSFYQTFKAAGFDMVVPYYSRLEYDMPSAQKRVLERKLVHLPPSASPDAEEDAAKMFLRFNTASLLSGFIMAARHQREVSNSFDISASPLYVINGDRYRASLKTPLTTPEVGDQPDINSIFQPKLSAKPILSIRRPLRIYGGVFLE